MHTPRLRLAAPWLLLQPHRGPNALALAALLLSSACNNGGSEQDPDPRTADADQDGVTVLDGDCDDFNDRVWPGADEVAGDGIDQDCDGEDLLAEDPTTGPEPGDVDDDEDGFTENEGDCDDHNDMVRPEAVEVAGDGIDQDCDGEELAPVVEDPGDVDDDADGYSENAGDCDDFNDTIHPGAREWGHDGVDSNCDGEELPQLGEDRYAEALPIIDTDDDGAISLEEFSEYCAQSAQVVGSARAGVVQVHVTCGGTNSCRGMILQSWLELFEHDCRGINSCAGWSCVEAVEGADRDGPTAFADAQCEFCHSADPGQFAVQIPKGVVDEAAFLTEFAARSDDRFLAAIAFGISGIDGDVAFQNMPAHYAILSRVEMDELIKYIRTLELVPADH